MSPGEHSQGGPPEGSTATLGNLLNAEKTRVPISEKEWVDLVRTIAAKDQRALHALYERTHRIVFTLTMRITNSREVAEEVTLDVFHDVWRRASTYDPAGGTVVGWIMNQARSRAIDRLRFEQRKKRVDPHADMPPVDTAPSEPHQDIDVGEQRRLLQDALAHLTALERQAIETAFFCELTYSETAQQLNQPLGTVKTRIRSALEKLRKALAGTGKEP
jgi:RNA polymerase sigma-70 factor (ECF subfamily)